MTASEVSDRPSKIHTVYNPWRRMRDDFPTWTVRTARLPAEMFGHTDSRTRQIHLAHDLLQTERRCTIEHEMQHAEAGDVGEQHPHREAVIEATVARRLVPLNLLLENIVWTHWVDELAEECWVDVTTMQCRLDNLTDPERAMVRRAIAIRDYHEEGLPEEPK